MIILNTVILAVEYYGMPEGLKRGLDWGNFVCTVIFALECAFRVFALGLRRPALSLPSVVPLPHAVLVQGPGQEGPSVLKGFNGPHGSGRLGGGGIPRYLKGLREGPEHTAARPCDPR